MTDYFQFDGVDEAEIRRQRDKARQLRKSRWWQQRLAAGICYYCSKTFKANDLTMDHVVPLSRGGGSTKDNLVTSCKDCNNKKKTLLPMEWEEYLKRMK